VREREGRKGGKKRGRGRGERNKGKERVRREERKDSGSAPRIPIFASASERTGREGEGGARGIRGT
jgi:hypothetical protein